MKKFKLGILFCICLYTVLAQKKADFEFPIYFEDAIGNRDTIIYRADSSVLDDPSTNRDNLNPDWGEEYYNEPFDSIFDVRAFIGYEFCKNPIQSLQIDGPCFSPSPFFVACYTKHWPIKVSWDPKMFQNNFCFDGALAYTDFYLTTKRLNGIPLNGLDFRCLKRDDHVINNYRSDSLFKTKNQICFPKDINVVGKGKVTICQQVFTFQRDWLDMCLPSSIDPEFEALNFSLVPTVVNQHLEIHFDQVTRTNFRIFDQVGNLIRNGNCHSANHQIMLDELPSGLYFIQIRDQENRIGIQKFVKM